MSTVATLVKNIIVKITNPFLQCRHSATELAHNGICLQAHAETCQQIFEWELSKVNNYEV